MDRNDKVNFGGMIHNRSVCSGPLARIHSPPPRPPDPLVSIRLLPLERYPSNQDVPAVIRHFELHFAYRVQKILARPNSILRSSSCLTLSPHFLVKRKRKTEDRLATATGHTWRDGGTSVPELFKISGARKLARRDG